MDGFFGIGFGELVMIAIVALIVLGPERLPSAFREVAKFIRQIRNLSKEFTDQFGDDFKALEDLNPRRLLQEAIDNIDEEENVKDGTPKPPAKKSTTTTTAVKKTTSSTTKPAAAKTGAAKTTTASATTKPAPESVVATTATVDGSADTTATADKKNDDTGSPETVDEKTMPESTGVVKPQEATPGVADSATTPALTTAKDIDAEPENRIAPPELVAAPTVSAEPVAEPAQKVVQTNGHAIQDVTAGSEAENVITTPTGTGDGTLANASRASESVDMSVVGNRQVEGEETQS